MRTGCRWTGLLDGDVCFELRLPRADFRREQAGSVSTVAPTDDNIFVHRTCFRFTCCTTGLQEYPWCAELSRDDQQSHFFVYSWLIFILFFFLSFHLFRRISRDKSANSRRETSEFPMNATTTTSYRVCIKNVRKPSFSTSEFRPSWKFDYYLRHQTRRASLLITRGSGQLLA